MVNMGRIHKEVGKFLMISSNLIKSDDESVIEIGENGILLLLATTTISSLSMKSHMFAKFIFFAPKSLL